MSKLSILGRSAVRGVILCALLGLGLGACAQSPETGPRILRVKGKVRFSADGQTWKLLKKGGVLPNVGTIQTAKKGAEVDLQLDDLQIGDATKKAKGDKLDPDTEPVANRVRLFEDSALDFKVLASAGATASDRLAIDLSLRAGQMLGTVRQLGAGSRYEVTYDAGVVGAGGGKDSQGSVFLLRSSGALAVLRGRMVIATAGADVRTVTVSGNEQFDPATGKVAPLAPEAVERKVKPVTSPEPDPPAAPPARSRPDPFQRPMQRPLT